MSPHDDDSPSSPEEDAASHQARLLTTAAESIELVSTFVPEIEALIARLETNKVRIKSITQTGLPTLARSLRREERTLSGIAEDLGKDPSTGDHRDATLTEDQLRDCGRKLDLSRVAVDNAHLKWTVLKRCRSIVSVNRNFQGSTKQSRREQVSLKEQQDQDLGSTISGWEKSQLHRALKQKAKVVVDVVDGGLEWLDIRSPSLNRLARQMAEAGWSWGDYEDPDEDVDPEEWESAPLAVHVRRLVEAVRLNRHDYTLPRVRIILPRIGCNDNLDVSVFLAQLTRIDPSVQVIIEDRDSAFMTRPTLPLETALDKLVGDPFASLTPTINVDHTILIDLISDITHTRLEPQPWQAPTTRAQIEDEQRHEDGLMASTVYPVLAGRRLLCTREAAIHFHDVLRTVGTVTECRRGRLLVPWDDHTRSMAAEEIRAEFVKLSTHPPPADVQVPITIQDTHWDEPSSVPTAVEEGWLPPVALDVARCGNFGSSKLSIYMQGWASGDVTVTSNKEIRGQIRTWVEANRQNEEDAGPHIYRLDVTRNLLAKSATPPEAWDGAMKAGDD